MDAVEVKHYEMWNMSISTLFGKSPKVKMLCGKCSYHFNKRFEPIDFIYGFPKAICPNCRTLNYVPITIKN